MDFYNESSDLVKYNQDNEVNGNKFLNLDSVVVNRKSTSDNELADKNNIDDELDKNIDLSFNQTLENHLKVSVGNNIYNLTKYAKIKITVESFNKYQNSGGYLLQNWLKKCNDENNNGKIQKLIKSTETNSPSSHSGATSLPPIGDSFMYIKTSYLMLYPYEKQLQKIMLIINLMILV